MAADLADIFFAPEGSVALVAAIFGFALPHFFP